jgi:hypothetical protein
MALLDSILLKFLPVQRLNNLRLSKASKENLKAEFTDELGRWWYTFQDEQDLPLIRLASQQTYLQYMAAGLTGKHFDEAMELLTECLAKQDIVKAGVVIHELNETPKKVVNLHALVNVMAVHYVRQDEDPNHFSQSIHQQKCDWMLEQIEQGSFFLSHPSLIRSLSPFNISGQQLTNSLHVFQKVMKEQKTRLDSLRSMLKAKESNSID